MARSKPIRWLLIAAVVIVALLAIGTTIRRRAERKRQASYQSVLRQYSTKLKPGMQRGEVEAFLASQGRAFEQTCCLSSVKLGSSALEDIVKIGSGPKLWYCSKNDMYLVFEFDSPPGAAVRESDASDSLRRVALVPWLGGCL
jgi:hypothetical protein